MIETVNFISGSGTTNFAVLETEKSGGILDGLVKTVAIISSDPEAPAIERAKDAGFDKKKIFTVDPTKELASQLLPILDKYHPDFFVQLGWFPRTPDEVIKKYKGVNQHLGPGGKWMYGLRRIHTHMKFCEMIKEQRPIPIFSHLITPEKSNYDEGDVLYVRWEKLLKNESPEQAQARLAPIEHAVQIEALRRLALGDYKLQSSPIIARTAKEEEQLLKAKTEAKDKYPPNKKLLYLPASTE